LTSKKEITPETVQAIKRVQEQGHVSGIPIAMGNAVEEVKNISNFVTLTNDENGVAYAIENYVLKH
jgi:hydroxymethylpyrimidine pyrophosphatase-like HAD family hydrolase